MLLPTEMTLKFNDNDIKDDTILSSEEKKELYRQIDLCDGFILYNRKVIEMYGKLLFT